MLDPAIFNNTNYQLVLIFLYAAIATWIAAPYVMKKCREKGYAGPDMHKHSKKKIPEFGGLAMLAGVLVSLVLSQLFFMRQESLGKLFIFYFVVLMYALYGIVDDIFHFKRRYDKIIALLVLSIPIASLIGDGVINLGFTSFSINLVYMLIIAPIFIMVVANLVNLHAGFNGLAMGTTLVVMIAAGVKSVMLFGSDNLIYLMPILGALFVFFFYNIYPVKMFEGNVGTFIVGGALGAFLIVNKMEIFGLIILIPHIITFVLDTWVLGILKRKDKEWPKVDKHGVIVVAKTMRYKSLKNVICTWFRLTEKQATWILIAVTAVFCFIGVMWI